MCQLSNSTSFPIPTSQLSGYLPNCFITGITKQPSSHRSGHVDSSARRSRQQTGTDASDRRQLCSRRICDYAFKDSRALQSLHIPAERLFAFIYTRTVLEPAKQREPTKIPRPFSLSAESQLVRSFSTRACKLSCLSRLYTMLANCDRLKFVLHCLPLRRRKRNRHCCIARFLENSSLLRFLSV